MPKLPTAGDFGTSLLRSQTAALYQQALMAHRDNRIPDAMALLRRILTADPRHTPAMNELAVIQIKTGAMEEGLRLFEALMRIPPLHSEWCKNYATALSMNGRFPEAEKYFRTVTELDRSDRHAMILYGNVLYYQGRYAEAEAAYQTLSAVDQRAALGLALVQQWTGRHQEAMACFDRYASPAFNNPLAAYAKAVLHILQGDLPNGFRTHERRWQLMKNYKPRSGQPLWLGETALAGKTLLIGWEQGLGDTLQFGRYATLAARQGARVIMDVQTPLPGIMSTLEGVTSVITEHDPLPEHDLFCPMMSLPLAFGTTIDTIPAQDRYLSADSAAVAAWATRLQPVSGKKIGLVWAGGSRPTQGPDAIAVDQRRSLPLSAFAPLGDVSGCVFFSLQLGPPAAQAAHPPEGLLLHDHTDELADFADTAALIENLDLVISVDTAVAHLAGALGKPVWLLNRYDTCWRWFLYREDSPWYPSMRIFRQAEPCQWTPVIEHVTQALINFSAAPVSIC